jgi:hypothetical protein
MLEGELTVPRCDDCVGPLELDECARFELLADGERVSSFDVWRDDLTRVQPPLECGCVGLFIAGGFAFVGLADDHDHEPPFSEEDDDDGDR